MSVLEPPTPEQAEAMAAATPGYVLTPHAAKRMTRVLEQVARERAQARAEEVRFRGMFAAPGRVSVRKVLG